MNNKFQHGDIFAVKGKGLTGWLSKTLIAPHSDRYHFGLIGDFIPWEREGEGDYVILESIGKGIAVGRLFYHYIDRGKDVEIYRVVHPNAASLGERACTEVSRLGRAKYDYLLILKIAIGVLQCWAKQGFKLRAIDVTKLPYGRNSSFICTEAAAEGWRRVGFPIIPKGVCPLPASFQLALERGIIEPIDFLYSSD